MVWSTLFFIGIAGIIAGVWYGTRSPRVTLAQIVASGGETIDLVAIERAADAALAGSYGFLVPKRFSFTYPQEAILAAVARIPRVEQARVERVSLTALAITITEHLPKILWCGVPETTGECVFISQTGTAFAKAPLLQGGVLTRYATEGRAPEVGATPLSLEETRAVGAFVAFLKQQHNMQIAMITETTDRDLRYVLQNGGEILMKKETDAEKSIQNLNTLLSSEEFRHLADGDFAHIDLRFGNKLFVKEPQ